MQHLQEHIVGAAIVHPEDWDLIRPRLADVAAALQAEPSTFVFLVKWQRPPINSHRDDGLVRSMVVPFPVLDRLPWRSQHSAEDLPALCFRAAQLVLGPVPVQRLMVWQCGAPDPEQDPAQPPAVSTTMILPHRGPLEFLATCLWYIAAQSLAPHRLHVAIDEPVTVAHQELRCRYSEAKWFRTEPPGCGPYVPRQALALKATTDAVVFQDSDDAPCYNRVPVLSAALASEGCDMIGSHELRVDELAGNVRAFRFPLDVTAALRRSQRDALFHPTSAVMTDAFRRSGGFSTNRRFASDLQFLFRASLTMRAIRNVDAFLYVRRRRRNSITTDPETHMRSARRLSLEQSWRHALAAVHRGDLDVSASSLAREDAGAPAVLVEIGQADNQRAAHRAVDAKVSHDAAG